MQEHIKVVIAENHRLYREAIGTLLGNDEHIKIVGEATNGLQAIYTIDNLKPDIALFGFLIHKIDDLKIISPIREMSPHTKPVLLNNTLSDNVIFKALEVGIRGYIPKNTTAPELVKAIYAVHQGELWAERKVMAKYFEEVNRPKHSKGKGNLNEEDELTTREIEVLRLLTTGLSNKEIARDMFISEKTVKSHLNRIFKKLKVTRRLEATLYAINQGLC